MEQDVNKRKLVTDKFRDDQLFYARLEGKFASLDDDRDRGGFWMKMNQYYGKDTEYWLRFMQGYKGISNDNNS